MTLQSSPEPVAERASSFSARGTFRLAAVCVLAHALIIAALIALNRPPPLAEASEKMVSHTWISEPEREQVAAVEPEPLPDLKPEPELLPEPELDVPPPPPLPPPPAMSIAAPPLNLATMSAVVVPTRIVRKVVETTNHFAPVVKAQPVVPPQPRPPAPVAKPAPKPVARVVPPPAPAGPMDAKAVDKPPRQAVAPAPPYPRLLQRRGASGFVYVEMLIDETGRVADLSVLENGGSDRFVESVTSTLQSWRFTPAEHNGRPVAVRATKRFTFQLR